HYLAISFFFFFNDTSTSDIYTLSLHDALPIYLHFTRYFPQFYFCLLQLFLLSQTIYGKISILIKQYTMKDSSRRKIMKIGQHSRSEEHTSELQSPCNLVCRLLLEKKKTHIRNS